MDTVISNIIKCNNVFMNKTIKFYSILYAPQIAITGQLNSKGTNTSLGRTGVFSAGKNDSEINILNPRTYTQIHIPTWYGGGEGFIGPLPKVFVMLQHFETILHSVEIL